MDGHGNDEAASRSMAKPTGGVFDFPPIMCKLCRQDTHSIDIHCVDLMCDDCTDKYLYWPKKDYCKGYSSRVKPSGPECGRCFGTRRKYYGWPFKKLLEHVEESEENREGFMERRCAKVHGTEAESYTDEGSSAQTFSTAEKNSEYKDAFEEGEFVPLHAFIREIAPQPYWTASLQDQKQFCVAQGFKPILGRHNIWGVEKFKNDGRYVIRRGVKKSEESSSSMQHASAAMMQESQDMMRCEKEDESMPPPPPPLHGQVRHQQEEGDEFSQTLVQSQSQHGQEPRQENLSPGGVVRQLQWTPTMPCIRVPSEGPGSEFGGVASQRGSLRGARPCHSPPASVRASSPARSHISLNSGHLQNHLQQEMHGGDDPPTQASRGSGSGSVRILDVPESQAPSSSQASVVDDGGQVGIEPSPKKPRRYPPTEQGAIAQAMALLEQSSSQCAPEAIWDSKTRKRDVAAWPGRLLTMSTKVGEFGSNEDAVVLAQRCFAESESLAVRTQQLNQLQNGSLEEALDDPEAKHRLMQGCSGELRGRIVSHLVTKFVREVEEPVTFYKFLKFLTAAGDGPDAARLTIFSCLEPSRETPSPQTQKATVQRGEQILGTTISQLLDRVVRSFSVNQLLAMFADLGKQKDITLSFDFVAAMNSCAESCPTGWTFFSWRHLCLLQVFADVLSAVKGKEGDTSAMILALKPHREVILAYVKHKSKISQRLRAFCKLSGQAGANVGRRADEVMHMFSKNAPSEEKQMDAIMAFARKAALAVEESEAAGETAGQWCLLETVLNDVESFEALAKTLVLAGPLREGTEAPHEVKNATADIRAFLDGFQDELRGMCEDEVIRGGLAMISADHLEEGPPQGEHGDFTGALDGVRASFNFLTLLPHTYLDIDAKGFLAMEARAKHVLAITALDSGADDAWDRLVVLWEKEMSLRDHHEGEEMMSSHTVWGAVAQQFQAVSVESKLVAFLKASVADYPGAGFFRKAKQVEGILPVSARRLVQVAGDWQEIKELIERNGRGSSCGIVEAARGASKIVALKDAEDIAEAIIPESVLTEAHATVVKIWEEQFKALHSRTNAEKFSELKEKFGLIEENSVKWDFSSTPWITENPPADSPEGVALRQLEQFACHMPLELQSLTILRRIAEGSPFFSEQKDELLDVHAKLTALRDGGEFEVAKRIVGLSIVTSVLVKEAPPAMELHSALDYIKKVLRIDINSAFPSQVMDRIEKSRRSRQPDKQSASQPSETPPPAAGRKYSFGKRKQAS